MSSEVLANADRKMGRAVEAMERDLAGLRTGRASTSLVERLPVEYYGTQTPLNQLAGISVPESHQIVIQPWDRSVLGAIEKAIIKSDIGLVPNVDWLGSVVNLNEFKQVVADPYTQKTSHQRIWAAGDCTDGKYHQNNIAAGDAVKALEDIYIFVHHEK